MRNIRIFRKNTNYFLAQNSWLTNLREKMVLYNKLKIFVNAKFWFEISFLEPVMPFEIGTSETLNNILYSIISAFFPHRSTNKSKQHWLAKWNDFYFVRTTWLLLTTFPSISLFIFLNGYHLYQNFAVCTVLYSAWEWRLIDIAAAVKVTLSSTYGTCLMHVWCFFR